jgi:aldehyde:ferredoxin oxidoreductase
VQAGDHTSLASIPEGDENSELNTVLDDSAVYCSFNTFSTSIDTIWDFFEAVTGWNTLRQQWYKTNGPRIHNLQRAMLLLGGPDLTWKGNKDDENPTRFYEPLPTGPYKGRAVNRKSFDESRKEYYEAVGWDENGLPKPETLKKLGLLDVEAKLKKARIM